MILVELFLCAPYSNAEVERFFNHMKYVKSSWRTSLNQQNLNCALTVKLQGASLEEFNEKMVEKCVTFWYNQKGRRIHQKKRKAYKKREIARKPRFGFASGSDMDQSE